MVKKKKATKAKKPTLEKMTKAKWEKMSDKEKERYLIKREAMIDPK